MEHAKRHANGNGISSERSHPLETRLLHGIDYGAKQLTQQVETLYHRIDNVQNAVQEIQRKVGRYFSRPQRRALAWTFVGGLLLGLWLRREQD